MWLRGLISTPEGNTDLIYYIQMEFGTTGCSSMEGHSTPHAAQACSHRQHHHGSFIFNCNIELFWLAAVLCHHELGLGVCISAYVRVHVCVGERGERERVMWQECLSLPRTLETCGKAEP